MARESVAPTWSCIDGLRRLAEALLLLSLALPSQAAGQDEREAACTLAQLDGRTKYGRAVAYDEALHLTARFAPHVNASALGGKQRDRRFHRRRDRRVIRMSPGRVRFILRPDW